MSVQSLTEVMKEIVEVNQAIEKLSIQKKDVLIIGDIHALSQIVQQETQLVKRLGRLEEERHQVVVHVTKELNISQDEVTFNDILAKIENQAERRQLEKMQQELTKLLQQIHVINDQNQQLLQQSLDFVNYSLELITDVPDEQTYQKPKLKESSYAQQKRSFFDTKA